MYSGATENRLPQKFRLYVLLRIVLIIKAYARSELGFCSSFEVEITCALMMLHATITGRVQGVGFRYFVRKAAEQRNLTGWVRNLPDGRVEAELEGDEDLLLEMEQLLWKGPAFSRVEDVQVTFTVESRNYSGFEVTR